MLFVCAAWCAFAAQQVDAEAQPREEMRGVMYGLVDDMQVPLSRTGETLGAIPAGAKLWDGGKVPYFIETAKPSASLALKDNDARIAASIVEWEAKTCIRFTKCSPESSCPKPYIYFTYHDSKCNSYVGINTGNLINTINLSPKCGKGATIHEIGHALGLAHEQVRKDRDSYVAINTAAIESTAVANFQINTGESRDIGPYDYSSIMHYSSDAFSKEGAGPTIITPHPTGQRSGLSAGDIATIQFIYNKCTTSYTDPVCKSSVDATTTHTIPYGSAFSVEFNAMYSTSLSVTHPSSTVPTARRAVEASSTLSNGQGYSLVTFTPSVADASKGFVISSTFTGTDGKTATCSVNVQVASTTTVCFGIAGNDATVCSGRGTCGSDPLAPCTCTAQYGGLDCSGFATCPSNYLYSFDDDIGTWIPSADVGFDSAVSASGGGSLRVGSDGNTASTYGSLSLLQLSKPARITAYLARRASTDKNPNFSIRRDTNQCMYLRAGSSVFDLSAKPTAKSTGEYEFHMIDIRMDWGAMTAALYINGIQVLTGQPIDASCSTGMNRVVYFGNGWLDEFHLWCTNYVTPTGTATNIAGQGEVRAGGLTLTLTLTGDHDTFVNSDANKQALVAALVADTNLDKGWNSVRSSIVDSSLVSINGATVTIGPFKASSTYASQRSELISVDLTKEMFTSGVLPASTPVEAGFRIPGTCEANFVQSFDSATDNSGYTSFTSISTTTKFSGASSLEFTNPGFIVTLGVGGVQAESLEFYARISDLSSLLHVTIRSSGSTADQLVVRVGNGGDILWGLGSDFTFGKQTLNVNQWYHVRVLFSWSASTFDVYLGSKKLGSGTIPSSMIDINSLRLNTQKVPAFLDEIKVTCPSLDPAFAVTPAGCTAVGTDATTFTITPGSTPLAATDKIAVVSGSATDCSGVTTECTTHNACSDNIGVLEKLGDKIRWAAGVLPKLQDAKIYKMCYKIGSADYVLLGNTFTTCPAGTATPAPPTPQPPTTPTPPGTQPTGTPGGTPSPPVSQCSDLMISQQARCQLMTISESCSSTAERNGCLWCRTSADSQQCLHVNEACGVLTVGLDTLNYHTVGQCPSYEKKGSGSRPAVTFLLAVAIFVCLLL
eukprot:TRINITY_DN14767_c0_g1_i1.p1 TRINITY_DN14767_c0_g1~~TRINITY_DN14767_c0_g1_i1.p1  ORF type:complete len:1117 (+),score=333.15 TRINITY_DN14767_c0_g1_i1:39-3389(+)